MTIFDAHRQRIRQWLEHNVPAGWQEELRQADDTAWVNFQRAWFKRLVEGGLAQAHLPRGYGGGASVFEQAIIHEEMARADAPEPHLYFVSLQHAAVTILKAGTPEQHERHLPAILKGRVWCQGFSEPDAGSDLASLRTRAVRHGDTYLVNGQKVWSSFAAHADWCLLLTRTDSETRGSKGLSYLLLDMRSPGVQVRPIRKLTGGCEFCEIFLHDVEIPVRERLGAEGQGWPIAQTTLATERGLTMLPLQARLQRAFHELACLAAASGAAENADLRQEFGRRRCDLHALRLMCHRLLAEVSNGSGTAADASVVKIYYSELLQQITDLGVRIGGLSAQLASGAAPPRNWHTGHWLTDHLSSWEWTIAGGTNEIQRNVVGERLLGLPKDPVR